MEFKHCQIELEQNTRSQKSHNVSTNWWEKHLFYFRVVFCLFFFSSFFFHFFFFCLLFVCLTDDAMPQAAILNGRRTSSPKHNPIPCRGFTKTPQRRTMNTYDSSIVEVINSIWFYDVEKTIDMSTIIEFCWFVVLYEQIQFEIKLNWNENWPDSLHDRVFPILFFSPFSG